MNDILNKLHEVAASPRAQMDGYLAQGKKIVLCAPVYTPEELIHAMGFVPMGAWGGNVALNRAKEYCPAFLCAIVQSLLELGINGAYEGASAMRELVRKSTTVICLATMLHTIATGNMTPSFRVMPDGSIRPVYLYAVDAAEFVVNKLLDRGSLSATTMVTNVQDFIGKVAGGLGLI